MEQQYIQIPIEVQYVQQRQGHSFLLHFLFGGILMWIPSLYFLFSPKHYFHL